MQYGTDGGGGGAGADEEDDDDDIPLRVVSILYSLSCRNVCLFVFFF